MNSPMYDAKCEFIEGNKTQHPLETLAALDNYGIVEPTG